MCTIERARWKAGVDASTSDVGTYRIVPSNRTLESYRRYTCETGQHPEHVDRRGALHLRLRRTVHLQPDRGEQQRLSRGSDWSNSTFGVVREWFETGVRGSRVCTMERVLESLRTRCREYVGSFDRIPNRVPPRNGPPVVTYSQTTKLQIDTCASRRQANNVHYENASFLLLVYDVSNQASFDSCGKWLQQVGKGRARGAALPGVLVANKMDLVSCGRRCVSAETGQAFAKANGLQYFETSARSRGVPTHRYRFSRFFPPSLDASRAYVSSRRFGKLIERVRMAANRSQESCELSIVTQSRDSSRRDSSRPRSKFNTEFPKFPCCFRCGAGALVRVRATLQVHRRRVRAKVRGHRRARRRELRESNPLFSASESIRTLASWADSALTPGRRRRARGMGPSFACVLSEFEFPAPAAGTRSYASPGLDAWS